MPTPFTTISTNMSSIWKTIALLCLCAFTQPSFAEVETTVSVEEILKKADDMFRRDHSIMVMEMYVKTAKYERTMKMKAMSLGTEKTLITILEPAKDAGTVTLKVEKNIWNYLPKVDKVMKLPSGMMGGSWMGSHLSNDDLVRENRFSEDFTTQLLTAPSASNPTEIYTIELIPKEDTPIVWGKIISKSRSDLIPLEVQYFDEDGTLKRIDKFEDVKEYDGVLMPTKFSVIPQDKQGEITTMTYVTVDFQTPVSEDMFSLQALRK